MCYSHCSLVTIWMGPQYPIMWGLSDGSDGIHPAVFIEPAILMNRFALVTIKKKVTLIFVFCEMQAYH